MDLRELLQLPKEESGTIDCGHLKWNTAPVHRTGGPRSWDSGTEAPTTASKGTIKEIGSSAGKDQASLGRNEHGRHRIVFV